MKQRKLISVLLVTSLLIASSFVLQSFSTGIEGGNVDVSYEYGKNRDSEHLLYVNIDEKDIAFEFAKCIEVFSDELHTNKIPLLNYDANESQMIFRLPNEMLIPDTLYIKAPILLYPKSIAPIATSISTNTTSNVSINDVAWFEIDNITLSENPESKVLSVNIIALDEKEKVPRFSKIVIGESEYGAVSSIKFDDDMYFETGILNFHLPLETDMGNMQLIIGDILLRSSLPNEKLVK